MIVPMRLWAMLLEDVFEHEQFQQVQAVANDPIRVNHIHLGKLKAHFNASIYAYCMSAGEPVALRLPVPVWQHMHDGLPVREAASAASVELLHGGR